MFCSFKIDIYIVCFMRLHHISCIHLFNFYVPFYALCSAVLFKVQLVSSFFVVLCLCLLDLLLLLCLLFMVHECIFLREFSNSQNCQSVMELFIICFRLKSLHRWHKMPDAHSLDVPASWNLVAGKKSQFFCEIFLILFCDGRHIIFFI